MSQPVQNALLAAATRAALTVCALLIIPWTAMRLTDEVVWDPADFIVAGVLLFAALFAWLLAVAQSGNRAYRLGLGVATAGTLVLVWANLAVGLVGSGENPANRAFLLVPVVGILGAAVARLRPAGMAYTMLAMAAGHLLATLFAASSESRGGLVEPLLVGSVFAVLYCAAAWLFRHSIVQTRRR